MDKLRNDLEKDKTKLTDFIKSLEKQLVFQYSFIVFIVLVNFMYYYIECVNDMVILINNHIMP